MFRRLNEVFGPRDEPRYIEAKQKVSELKATANQLTIHKIELAIGEIDKYSGTTVKDLMVFMQAHNLRFAAAVIPEERRLYLELLAALIQQRDTPQNKLLVAAPSNNPIATDPSWNQPELRRSWDVTHLTTGDELRSALYFTISSCSSARQSMTAPCWGASRMPLSRYSRPASARTSRTSSQSSTAML